jgi:hypothetical protein
MRWTARPRRRSGRPTPKPASPSATPWTTSRSAPPAPRPGTPSSPIVADFAAARAKDPDADPAKLLADLQKSDPYLFKATTTNADSKVDEDPATRKSSTDLRGGKTTSTHKPESKRDDNIVPITENDPKKIRADLARSGLRVS